jgi:hypothetical protein
LPEAGVLSGGDAAGDSLSNDPSRPTPESRRGDFLYLVVSSVTGGRNAAVGDTTGHDLKVVQKGPSNRAHVQNECLLIFEQLGSSGRQTVVFLDIQKMHIHSDRGLIRFSSSPDNNPVAASLMSAACIPSGLCLLERLSGPLQFGR